MFAIQLFYLPLITVVKLTFFLFIKRLFYPNRKVEIATQVGIFSCLIFYTIIFFRALFVCSPMEKIWNPLVPGHCLDIVVLPYTSGIFNIISDFYILLIPLPLVWNLNMKLSRKLRLTALFSVGLVYGLNFLRSLVHQANTRQRLCSKYCTIRRNRSDDSGY